MKPTSIEYRAEQKTPELADGDWPAVVRSLLDACGDDKRLRALILLCWTTAARPESGPCRLRWSDIVFEPDEGVVSINGWAPQLGTLTYSEYKAQRLSLPLHPMAAEALADWRSELRGKGRAYRGTDLVFPKRPIDGAIPGPWCRGSYAKAWRDIRAKAAAQSGLETIGGMWLRHLRNGALGWLEALQTPESVRAAIANHSVGTMTQHYVKVSRADKEQAVLALTPDTECRFWTGAAFVHQAVLVDKTKRTDVQTRAALPDKCPKRPRIRLFLGLWVRT